MAEQLMDDNPFHMGREALAANRSAEALGWFTKAIAVDKTPLACSYLAYCLAKEKGTYRENIALCMDALKEEPQNSNIYLNLGRIYLLAGQKRSALRSFQLGLRYSKNSEILAELSTLGWRKPPLIKFLPREHPINKYVGKFLTKIRMR